jgi:hypothetical protein
MGGLGSSLGVRRLPARMKLKKINLLCSKHAEMHSNTLLLPFY